MLTQITHKSELKSSIEASRKELEAKVQEAMADAKGRSHSWLKDA